MFPDLHLAFRLILKIASRLLHPYSTDVKTSRLMVKQFSTARNTQRNSQSYVEKREEGDRGESLEQKWAKHRSKLKELIEVTKKMNKKIKIFYNSIINYKALK